MERGGRAGNDEYDSEDQRGCRISNISGIDYSSLHTPGGSKVNVTWSLNIERVFVCTNHSCLVSSVSSISRSTQHHAPILTRIRERQERKICGQVNALIGFYESEHWAQGEKATRIVGVMQVLSRIARVLNLTYPWFSSSLAKSIFNFRYVLGVNSPSSSNKSTKIFIKFYYLRSQFDAQPHSTENGNRFKATHPLKSSISDFKGL
ncbi:uncharacterized protein LACBIDRAFT_328709 [Laccaria bicolor S238N-H82]|uniref:Predicted protein n=1 Tax=Laccaria bicolor (strain S238N-H82 / ATCC MYA-4686) TaxID=486041 RepID=B0DFR3_LACBS|nr:uncharacterized protein LACBIDRAFT_328709 [Laccaria bicolor S238N-H82]EDR06506.1 predicted protein [Laccaria bicolor S238N-H82]|eukprot:XP_001882878.1 predicted protein [Laccaria bicolor S238N-H82]